MPDWSYTTLLAPAFRRLPHDFGRRFVNGFLGTMSALPGGGKVIDLMGHMAPHPGLATTFLDCCLPSPVILAPAIDPRGQATRAFGKFGFGGLTIGPFGENDPIEMPVFAQTSAGTLWGSGGPAARWADLAQTTPSRDSAKIFAELLLDLSHRDLSQVAEVFFTKLDGRADLAIVSPQSFGSHNEANMKALALVCDTARRHGLKLLLGMPDTVSEELACPWAQACQSLGVGVYLSGHSHSDGGWEWGGAQQRSVNLVKTLKTKFPGLAIAADSGVLAPTDALELVKAGADLVVVSAGLVQTGPGLAKRINDALLFAATPDQDPNETRHDPPPERMAWLWAAFLGLCMLVGAGLAGWVALTDVVLPYDEEFCGKSAAEIAAFNPRILSFMTHDRITLSGTMVSLGILYVALAWFEIRRGSHWAQRTVQVSAATGFLSFFAFLGYGYFDPFHAMVAAILTQITIQVIVLPAGPGQRRQPSESFSNDRAWRRGMWGQLLFVIHGAALMLAGCVILTYGVSEVFVPQDIEYMGMDAQRLAQFDPQLKALIAHDRATFGGMLVSAGVALLLTTLWGFRRGEPWLWWVYLMVISEPYLQTLWIHYSIGYRDQFHLTPVYIGLVLLIAGLAASREYLTGRHA